ncbi:MAG: hypothetical protein AAF368_06400 [Planctomycetota bacterium]
MTRSDLHPSRSSSAQWPLVLLSVGFVAGLALAVSFYHGSRSEARELLAGPMLELPACPPPLLPLREEGALQEERGPAAYEAAAPLAESFESKSASREIEPQCAEAVCPLEPEASKLEPADPSSVTEPVGKRVLEVSSKVRRVATAEASSRKASKKERPARAQVQSRKRRRSGTIQGAVVGVQIEAAVRSQPPAETPTHANPVHLEEFGDGKPSRHGGLGGLRD